MSSPIESAMIAQAFDQAPAGLSARSCCKALARRVVRHLIETADCADPVQLALNRTAAAVEQDPAFVLATDPEVNLFGSLCRERLRRFEARGCRQLDPAKWEAETKAIAAALECRLAERFRKVVTNWGKWGESPKRRRHA